MTGNIHYSVFLVKGIKRLKPRLGLFLTFWLSLRFGLFTKREIKRRPCAWLRLAAERANEVPDDVLAKRRAKVMAKNQAKRAQEQAWEAARLAQKTQQIQNVIAKNNNLAQAEAEMGKVKPVTPYVAASYIDKDEEKRLKGQGSQRAWAAVNVQEQAKQE